jgi:hypothetical protein
MKTSIQLTMALGAAIVVSQRLWLTISSRKWW